MARRSAARSAAVRLGMSLVLTVLVGCQSPEEQVDDLVAEAEAYRASEQYREALISLREALRITPKDASLNLLIAETLDEMDRHADASFYYGEAYRLDPSLTEAALTRAPLLYGSDPEAARALVAEVLEREPDNHMAYLRRAELELLDGDGDAALASALTSAELAPRAPESHRIVGTVYQTLALERLRDGKDASPQFRSALEALQRAQDLEETWYHRNDIAKLHSVWPGHAEEARESWRKAFEIAHRSGDEEGMRSVAVEARTWAVRNEDRELLRWALERRLEVDPGRIQTWQQVADLAESETPGAGDAVWQRALDERPDDPRIHVGYVNHLGSGGRPEEAIAYLESLPPDVADSPDVQLVLVKAYVTAERLDEARAALARMKELHPGNPRTRFAEGRVAFAEGRMNEAARILREVAQELDRPDAYRVLAQAELSRGESRAALAAIDRALEANPTGNPALYRLRHRSQMVLGDWEGVLRSLRQMRQAGFTMQLREMLDFTQASYELGRVEQGRQMLEHMLDRYEGRPVATLAFVRFEGRRQPERARELLESAIAEHGPGPRLVHGLVALELASGDPEAALRQLDRLPEEGVDTRSRLLRARALARLERWPEAEVEARTVFESDDGSAAAARLLARILSAQGRQGEAIAALESARAERRLAPRNLWLLGRLYMEEDRLPEARKVLEEALGAAPQLQVAANDLAFVLAETGEDLDRALALARQARSGLPESPAVADTLGWVYYRRGMLEPAATEFRAALDLAEDDAPEALRADLHYHLGLVLLELGRPDEALRAIERALELEPEHEQALGVRARLIAAASETGS